jgi:uncharacterized membrane protein YkoI
MVSMMPAQLAAIGLALATMGAPSAHSDQAAPKRSCLSPSETRETVAARKLSTPFTALRTAAGHAHGETLGMRLCRVSDDLVYEVTVLRRDGRVVKVVVDALTGKVVRTLNDR